jgi:hypothetical protein
MKHLLLLALLLTSCAFTACCWAQTPTSASTPQSQYCSLLAMQEGYQSNMKMQLDYGQGIGLSKEMAARMKEQADYVHSLNTIVDALNYLGVQGWEYLGFNSILLHGNYVHRYMLQRPVR